MEKKTAHMSAAEIREQRLKVLYRILPIVSLLLLVALWLLASSGANSNFPTPQAVWDRTVRLFTNPVKKLTLVGHALVSLRRIGLALVFDWTAGIAFGVLLGWCPRARAFFGPLFNPAPEVPRQLRRIKRPRPFNLPLRKRKRFQPLLRKKPTL